MCRGRDVRARNLADCEGLLAFEAVEVLGEAASVGFQVVPLDEEHEQGVELVEGVKDPQ